MTAVDSIISGRKDKANIWDVNTEKEYHEVRADEKTEEPVRADAGTPDCRGAVAICGPPLDFGWV